MNNYTIAMVGYDISHLSGYIRQIEETTSDDDGTWIDGIPEYSLNFPKNKIGYDSWTKSMFGIKLIDLDDVETTEDGTFETFPISDIEKHRAEIWNRYKSFLFDHTKITDQSEPPYVLKFISWYS